MKVSFRKYVLKFKKPSGTSRGVLIEKETFFILIENGNKFGIGECGLFRGLSFDDVPNFEKQLARVCEALSKGEETKSLTHYFPSIRMGVEVALKSFNSNNPYSLFNSNFSYSEKPIEINGLVWMGDIDFMRNQVFKKIEDGFSCVKLKIGALDFKLECELLSEIRKNYSNKQVVLRLDANGAFSADEALKKLEKLSNYDIHSIEQPIATGQYNVMKTLCASTPIPIALDEDLIGIVNKYDKEQLVKEINPQYIIIKPSLLGGFNASEEWINIANKNQIGWWVTSALESNIGLNAIAQWTSTLRVSIPQGLGTGGLFTNNIDSPLVVDNGKMIYDQSKIWGEI
jgi:o-succinylbenzoate synthase